MNRPLTTWVPYGSTWAVLPEPEDDFEEDFEEDFEDAPEDQDPVYQGESWGSSVGFTRTAHRDADHPEVWGGDVGFRLCFKGGAP